MKKRKSAYLWLHRPKKHKTDPSECRETSTSVTTETETETPPPSVTEGDEGDNTDEISPEKRKFISLSADKSLIDKLSQENLLYYFVLFYQLVKENKYPLTNIALLLFLETVRWFSCSTIQEMWYWETTKNFWRVGYRLFHGKFLTFMSGPKSIGTFIFQNSTFRNVSPHISEINFAVPSRTVLINNVTNIPSVLKPGVMKETLESVTNNTHCNVHMLCVDGKKVTAGLDKEFGDVDMFGHEDSPTILQQKDRIAKEIQTVEDIKSVLPKDEVSDPCNIDVDSTVSKLKELIHSLTMRIKDVRSLKTKQEYGLEKLKERAGPNWKTSKYLFAISGIQAFLYRVKLFIDNTLLNIGKLCKLASDLNSTTHDFCSTGKVNPYKQRNMYTLKDYEQQVHPTPTNHIKQKSLEWHGIRNSVTVTGSTLHNAIGLRGLKHQREHYDTHVLGKEKPQVPSDVQKYLDHGVNNEPNAIATLVSRFMPVFYPKEAYVEEGCYLLNSESKYPLLVVSPDGSIRENEDDKDIPGENIAAIEIKCPFPKSSGQTIYYEVPKYYICQCLAEMNALGVKTLIFQCYTSDSSTFFMMDYDESLWNTIMQGADEIYGKYDDTQVTKLKPFTKDIKQMIESYAQTKIRLIAEIPSIEIKNHEYLPESSSCSPYFETIKEANCVKFNNQITSDLNVVLMQSEECLQTGYQLSRRKASEVMVWVLSNKDRMWSSELPNSVPVAYGLKDYRFSAVSLRNACNDVLSECVKRNLKIPLLAFDGQWYSLMVRDSEGNPLTKLQLQKDVWKEVAKMKKKEIVDCLAKINTVVIDDKYDRCSGFKVEKHSNGLTVSSIDIGFQTVTSSTDRKYWSKKMPSVTDISNNQEEANVGLKDFNSDWIPESVIKALEENGDDELLTTIYGISKEISDKLTRESMIPSQNEENEDKVQITVDTENGNDSVVQGEESQQHEDMEVPYELQTEHVKLILSALQNGKRKEKWKDTTTNQLQEIMMTAEKMSCLTKAELDIIVHMVKDRFGFSNISYKKSWSKGKIVNCLCNAIGDKSKIPEKKIGGTYKISSLKDLSLKALRGKSVPKAIVNIAYAQYIFPTRLQKWQTESVLGSTCNIAGIDCDLEWYSHPEKNEITGELLCKCIDSHHLLTNLRIKTSTAGLENINANAWKRVAKSYRTKLTPAMVDDLVDKQSNAFAQTHFSEEVENEMTSNGDFAEATFCKLIRRWYEAEDLPALSTRDRITRWLDLKQYLLNGVNFGIFPPNAQFIKGMSVISFEGFLTGIDTKIQLYALCDGSYCVRTASSLPAETCVGGIQDMNLNNTMSVKAKDIPRIMSSLAEVMMYKCNPERGFYMKTSRSAVYKPAEGVANNTSGITECKDLTQVPLATLNPVDHMFDNPERRRTKARRKLGTTTSDLDAPPKGTQPMRQEYHKCNESKILPWKRTCILMDDT